MEKEQNGAASKLFGEMVWLYSMSNLHRNWAISSVHRWIIPALKNNQYRIYRKGSSPIGMVTWAWMSVEVEKAYVLNPNKFESQNWKSGDRLWALDFIAPFGDSKHIVDDLRNNIFPDEIGRTLHVKKGSDTMRIKYLHGVNALKKRRDPKENSPVLQRVSNDNA